MHAAARRDWLPGFEAKPVKPRCRRVSDLLPSLDAFESFARARRTGRLLDSPSSSPTWPTPSSSLCTLALPCTVWTAHGSARPPRVPRSRPTRIHPSPSWSLGMNLSLLRAYSRPSFTRSFSMNLSPNIHLAPSNTMPHPTPAHHEPRDTSNSHDVVNHSSSKGDHHWSSLCRDHLCY